MFDDYDPNLYFQDDFDPQDMPDDDEPLLAWLLGRAIDHLWPGDACLADFREFVLPKLLNMVSIKAAKGGTFAANKAAEGNDTSRYKRDQSMRAHLLNGLLGSLNLLRLGIKAENAAVLRFLDDGAYGQRLLIATYLLHDYTKLVDPDLHSILENPSTEAMPAIRTEIKRQASELALIYFIERSGQPFHLDDLIYAIHNTQVKWGTLSVRHLEQRLSDSVLVGHVASFSRIADLLAYTVSVNDETFGRINDSLSQIMQERPFDLVAHRVTQVVGVLTAYIHNAVLEAFQVQGYVPLLFTSQGVIYATPRHAEPLNIVDIAAQVTQSIRNATRKGVWQKAGRGLVPGLSKDGKGLKIGQHLSDLFSAVELLSIAWRYLVNRQYDAKKMQAEYTKGVENKWWDDKLLVYCDERIGPLMELLAFAEREKSFDAALVTYLIAAFGLNPASFEELRKAAQSGGKRYWTAHVATHIIANRNHFSPEDVALWVEDEVLAALHQEYDSPPPETLLDDLQAYIQEVLVLPQTNAISSERFGQELALYTQAKAGGNANFDTIFSLSYGVVPQEEASIPYKPTPYSQRVILGRSKESQRRGISSIGLLNLLLLQLGMDRPFNFQDNKARMLTLYPAYFFTPETGKALRDLQSRLQNFELASWLKHTDRGLDCSPETVIHYHAFLKQSNFRGIQSVQYPTHIAPFMVQLVINSGIKKTEIEAWLPALMISLILSTVVDVKVSASASPIPLFASGEDFDETVFLDAPHSAFSALVGHQLTIDDIESALQKLTILAAAVVDAYGFKYLNQMAGLGQRVADDPANILTCYQRLTTGRDPYKNEAQRYLKYTEILAESTERNMTVNHARELVRRYRGFYRASGYKTNAILRPIQEAAKLIAEADAANSDHEMLRDAIIGKMNQIESALMGGRAKGYAPGDWQERDVAIRDFADYFVYDYYLNALRGRKALLRGTQFNLLRLACDAVYRELDAEARDQRAQNEKIESEED